jgi:hypothetical protein
MNPGERGACMYTDLEVKVESATERATRWIAARSPRRSFLGKVGRAMLVSAAGGVGSAVLWQESAQSVPDCDINGHSVRCVCLTGSNSCPSGTCECGSWGSCPGEGDLTPCSPQITFWHDCCDLSGCTSACVDDCGRGTTHKCYYKKPYPGGCGTVNVSVIRCRYYACSSFSC